MAKVEVGYGAMPPLKVKGKGTSIAQEGNCFFLFPTLTY